MNSLDELVAAVLNSSKYNTIDVALIEAIATRELAIRPNFRTALKETKARLHQIAGAYFERPPGYKRWLDELQMRQPAERPALCRTIMAAHASTRERQAFLDDFYRHIFAKIPPASRIIDLACGLNPLATPWMNLAPGTFYRACDIYHDLCAFLSGCLPLLGMQGAAEVCDLVTAPPPWPADVAFILKTLPVLEQVRRGAGYDLLRALHTPWMVVSFPTRSLGGRNVGMAAHYTAQMQAICAAEQWQYATIEFPNELVFLVEKRVAS
ncbi:MAG: 16S rRNA methyltransferase [Oscillochloris sp.]|nr:16S rRNA methyltransferase [Oscillochloris sp.]